ncbi:DNA polymerase IV [Asanoa siamensis]|uniref:DNA polymerase IV n=1 Tax=Asanoa siamensis TaxID=926357 RepID=A0ABQ4CQD5_9ACTN|nr:DNA polymerase IV [Asanoa siamensis]GIF73504.1 DNA polymerase IV [Asanoa siamensis]
MTALLHVDMDQFVAAVEILRRPELRGRPVVVGGAGDPTARRQVVSTASYEARAFGVHSGMPLRRAAQLCPEAVFLPTDPAAYGEASERVMAVLRRFPVDVEVWGWDEAFVGGDIADPEALAAELKAAVFAETGLTCAIGIGDNKLQAKMAARFAKPGGIHRLTTAGWMAVMGERPAADLWGIGPKTSRKLDELGLHTVAQLAAAPEADLVDRFGPRQAAWLPVVAAGGGDTQINTEPWVARSRSRENTYAEDLSDLDVISREVAAMARALTAEVVADGREITHVAVKVRYVSFFTPTREMKLRSGPTTDPEAVEQAAVSLLAKFEWRRPVRLLGVRVNLAMPD